MAQTELDSFVSKLKSLWHFGFSANLNVKTEGGKVSVSLEADLGYAPPPFNFPKNQTSQQNRGPAYQRRQARRRVQKLNAATVSSNRESGADTAAEAVTENTIPENYETTEQVAAHTEGPCHAACSRHDNGQNSAEVECTKLSELKAKIVELEQEVESKNNTIAVQDMLFEDFKERVKIKYLYSSNDEDSEYESDEERRELIRRDFWQRKLQERHRLVLAAQKNKDGIDCKECDYVAKSENSLKTHMRRKH